MRLHNTTDFPNEMVKDIVRMVRPSGISGFDIELRNSDYPYAGRAYITGSSYHKNRCPFIVVRIGGDKHFPMTVHYHDRDSAPHYEFWNRMEALVGVLAHELRHLWQGKQRNRRGYAWGTRGKYSEVDAEAYTLGKLREWRKRGSRC